MLQKKPAGHFDASTIRQLECIGVLRGGVSSATGQGFPVVTRQTMAVER
jgi:hypothetical protein